MFSLQTIFGSGNLFFDLLDEAADAAHESTKALVEMLKEPAATYSLEPFKHARQRGRVVSDKINHELVDNFITPIEREDIESLASAIYKIPKQVERFADRYDLARHRLEHIDFAPRGLMLEQAAGVVVEMVKELRSMRIEKMSKLNERLRVIEAEADRLLLELHREIYSGNLDAADTFLLKEFFDILEKAIDRCREAGVVAYQIVLKNS